MIIFDLSVGVFAGYFLRAQTSPNAAIQYRPGVAMVAQQIVIEYLVPLLAAAFPAALQ